MRKLGFFLGTCEIETFWESLDSLLKVRLGFFGVPSNGVIRESFFLIEFWSKWIEKRVFKNLERKVSFHIIFLAYQCNGSVQKGRIEKRAALNYCSPTNIAEKRPNHPLLILYLVIYFYYYCCSTTDTDQKYFMCYYSSVILKLCAVAQFCAAREWKMCQIFLTQHIICHGHKSEWNFHLKAEFEALVPTTVLW